MSEETTTEGRYLALYRRYRPGSFGAVLGQGAVVESLQASLASGRYAHAYLFCGPRGTGKTSVARLLARAVNCEALDDGEPCGTCGPCAGFLAGELVDIHEIDAASNRRIAEMRDLLDQVGYSPTRCRHKVYILDEAHMLTGEAANAFLKTLEEPPPHVIFVLATTEAHKILPTISSRCQVYEFQKIPEATCRDLLVKVAKEEGATLEPGAAALVAARSGGAMRDALALLEQLLSGGATTVTREDATRILGLVPEELLVDLVESIAGRDAGGVYRVLDIVTGQGRDPRKLLVDLIAAFRGVLRYQAGVKEALSHHGPEARSRLERQGDLLEERRLLSILSRLDRGMVEARQGVLPAFSVELTLLEAGHLDVVFGREDLEARLATLEATSRGTLDAPGAAVAARDAAPKRVAGPAGPDPAPAARRAVPASAPNPEPAASQPRTPARARAEGAAAPSTAGPDLASAPVATPPAPTAASESPPPGDAAAPEPASTVSEVAPEPASESEAIPGEGPAAAAAVAKESVPGEPGDAESVVTAPVEDLAPATPSQGHPPAAPADDLSGLWKRIIQKASAVNVRAGAFLKEGSLTRSGDRLIVQFASEFHHKKSSEPANRAVLEELLAEELGEGLELRMELQGGGGGSSRGGGSFSSGGSGSSSGGAPARKKKTKSRRQNAEARDWYEDRVLSNETVQEAVEAFDGKVVRID